MALGDEARSAARFWLLSTKSCRSERAARRTKMILNANRPRQPLTAESLDQHSFRAALNIAIQDQCPVIHLNLDQGQCLGKHWLGCEHLLNLDRDRLIDGCHRVYVKLQRVVNFGSGSRLVRRRSTSLIRGGT